ncbi:MAG TPA: pyridoxamine 5'-phosphate oxidase family protein [bacterium]|nr:pyridoxamine 5'-phosphate oxidase family protein [bacterium]
MAISKQAALIKIIDVLGAQRFTTLATDTGDELHTSLVCYTFSKDLHCLFFGTPRTTRKYKNLKKNGKNAFNVSDHRNEEDDTHRAFSVTAHGTAYELVDDREKYAALLIKRFPRLERFYRDPAVAIFRVKIDEYSITGDFQDVVTIGTSRDFCKE